MIPKTIDDVSSSWLAEVLATPIKDMQITQIGQGVGIMGDIFRVDLNYAQASASAPASVVVKLPSSFEENRAQGVALGMFDAEVRFYKEMAAQVPTGLPQIYHADIDPGTADFVIVMQDLCDLALVEQSRGMSASQAAAAVTVLAAVHSTWWDRVQGGELDWIPSMIGDRIAMVDQMLLQILPVFLANFGERLTADEQRVYELFAGRYLAINQTIAGRSPWTLVHQDYRVENLMFGGDDGVVVIDWQGIGRGPGAYDLAYVLSGSMQTELRRQHEGDLTRLYHAELLARGVSGYDYDALWADYQTAQLMGGLATAMVVGGGMDLSNERGVELGATMATRHARAALDHNGLEFLNTLAASQE